MNTTYLFWDKVATPNRMQVYVFIFSLTKKAHQNICAFRPNLNRIGQIDALLVANIDLGGLILALVKDATCRYFL